MGPKILQKSIVDAERHRRTPRTPVTDGQMVESKASADIGDIGAESGRKSMPKTPTYDQKGSQNQCTNASKINATIGRGKGAENHEQTCFFDMAKVVNL